MRSLPLAVLLLAAASRAAAAPHDPRSLALELGWTADPAGARGGATPVALAGSWWLGGALDATARVAWASAARTGVRGADGVLEVGAGLRHPLAGWGDLRALVGGDLALATFHGEVPAAELRLVVAAELEAQVTDALTVGLTARAAQALRPAPADPTLTLALALRTYF